ncbi:MAG: hypothetical protein ACI4OT_02935 [Bacilli bacterium]
MNKSEKKSGKGLKVLAVLLLIISLCLIGSGVYLKFMNDNKKEEPKEEVIEEPIITEEELDIDSDEVVSLFNLLQLNNITNPVVSSDIKDYYFTKNDINDDLKLYLGISTLDKVVNFDVNSTTPIEIEVKDIEDNILKIFDSERTDKTYKDFTLNNSLVAKYNSETNKYSIEVSNTEVTDKSQYYGEVVSAKKEGDIITLVIRTYYASYEDIDNNPETPSVFNLYKDSTKSEKISEIAEGYTELPKIKDTSIDENKFQDYEFIFTSSTDGYKLTSFNKVTK